jgi:hypothetical protein
MLQLYFCSEINKLRVEVSSLTIQSLSCGQQIPLLLQNPNVHYGIHNSSPLDPILSHMQPVDTLHIRLNINLTSSSSFQI